MFDVEVDQSGKVEDTGVITVIALTDGIQRAIVVPAHVKQAALHLLRQRSRWPVAKKPVYNRLFAVVLFLLLKDVLNQVERITLNIEYEAREGDIKGMLLECLRRIDPQLASDRIVFRRIGKLALDTYRGERAPDRVVSERELLEVV